MMCKSAATSVQKGISCTASAMKPHLVQSGSQNSWTFHRSKHSNFWKSTHSIFLVLTLPFSAKICPFDAQGSLQPSCPFNHLSIIYAIIRAFTMHAGMPSEFPRHPLLASWESKLSPSRQG